MLSHETGHNKWLTSLNRDFLLNKMPLVWRFLVITLGGLHTWAAMSSHSMNADGISYLDIGEAYLRGDWGMAINSVWSPMYSWILGLILYVLEPPMQWEFPAVHLVNFAIYVGTLVSFESFWRQLWRYQHNMDVASRTSRIAFPEWTWWVLGYSLFTWSSLNLIEIWSVTPDMLMAAFVYLAAGVIIRIRSGSITWPIFMTLGLILGLGYLAKAPMFLLAFVFLMISLFTTGSIRRAIPRVIVALIVFLLVSIPFIIVVSLTKGELTFGDAGTLTYVRHVNGIPYPHWQGEPPDYGIPEHPSRKIFDKPPIYEFGDPIGGTYPISLDPSYWYAGVIVNFDWGAQLTTLFSSAFSYFDLFFRQLGALVAVILIFYLMGYRRRSGSVNILHYWGLTFVALVALAMYAPVLVAGRYVSVFVVLFWADLLANVCLPESQMSRRLVTILSTIMILFILMNIIVFNLEGYVDLTGHRNIQLAGSSEVSTPPSWPGEVAEELHRLGLQAGDRVAIIGYGFDSFWARLARVKIVAELLGTDAEPFWRGDSSVQSEVIQAFSSTGARAIVAESVPSYASLSGWHQVGNSNYYIYLLDE